MLDKDLLRQSMRKKLKDLTDLKRLETSRVIAEELKQFKAFNESSIIAAFAAMPDEIDLLFLWTEYSEKSLLLPRYQRKSENYVFTQVNSLENETIRGKFDILEPKEELPTFTRDQQFLCFIPGLAFDRQGGRLGRGKGFYDQLLADKKAVKVAVCYDFQLCVHCPQEEWDVKMDYILTEKRLIKCK